MRRAISAVVAAVALCVGAGGVMASAPAGAAGWTPAPGTTPTTPSYVYLQSQAGDYVGQGRTYSYVPATSDIEVKVSGSRIDVGVEGDLTWFGVFSAPVGVSSVVVGRYTTASIATSQVGTLAFSGDGRGCGSSTGWYEIDSLTKAGVVVTGLTMRFEQRCSGQTAVLNGKIVWDATAPIPGPPTPSPTIPAGFWRPPVGAVPASAVRSLYVSSQPGDPIGEGRTQSFIGGDLAGLIVEVREQAIQTFYDGAAASWSVDIGSSNRSTFVSAGYYAAVGRYGFNNRVRGGFSFLLNSAGCNESLSDVALDEVDGRGGQLADITVRFQQDCDDAGALARGELRWQPPAPLGTKTAPTTVAAERRDGAARLLWTAATGGSSATTGYRITTYRNGNAISDTNVGDVTSAVVSGLDPGARYTFKVAAINGAGVGHRSRASNPVVPQLVPGPILGPFLTLSALVTQQHLDFKGRAPTAAELASALDTLNTTSTSTEAWVAGLRNAAEWGGRRAAVIRLYNAYFLRGPDTAGLEYWAGRIAGGTTISQVSSSFAASKEFKERYGALSNADFVKRVYQNVLGRQPDAAGLAFWTDRLARGTSRGAVMIGFSESAENKGRMQRTVDVVLVHLGLLRRTPSTAELASGVSLLAGGGTVEGYARQLLLGTEYAARVS